MNINFIIVRMNLKIQVIAFLSGLCPFIAAQQPAIYQSKAFSIFPNKVIQGDFNANVISPIELTSNYRSP